MASKKYPPCGMRAHARNRSCPLPDRSAGPSSHPRHLEVAGDKHVGPVEQCERLPVAVGKPEHIVGCPRRPSRRYRAHRAVRRRSRRASDTARSPSRDTTASPSRRRRSCETMLTWMPVTAVPPKSTQTRSGVSCRSVAVPAVHARSCSFLELSFPHAHLGGPGDIGAAIEPQAGCHRQLFVQHLAAVFHAHGTDDGIARPMAGVSTAHSVNASVS